MLIEFSVENFKSFRDRTTFSMIAANIKSAEQRLDEENTVPVSDDLRLLTSAAIYGKNASGKSNLGAALQFMKQFVLISAIGTQSITEIPVFPFRLNTRTREHPSSFEIVFLIEGTQFRYGFEADEKQIVSEWLFYVPSRREYALFERAGQEINVKSGFKEGRGLEDKTRNNALFLSVVAQFNGPVAKSIVAWFQHLTISSDIKHPDFHSFTMKCLRDGHFRDEIIDFINSLDVDISDLFIPEPLTEEQLPKTFSEEQKAFIIDGQKSEMYAVHPVYNEQGEVITNELLRTDHEESQGTQRLIAMAGPLQNALKHGLVMFIDGMDAQLHTYMTAAIVKLFNSRRTNPHGAQLIFVTHDTNLLDNTLLRRDQIWFVEKDKQGATRLVSLAEYRERNNVDFEQRYLGGRYGGVPYLDELSDLVGSAHG